jgi:SulP family sulfate permease
VLRLPILEWVKTYNRSKLSDDAVAAVIVTIMLIPQSLAYAMLAGLPPEVGLYASILPLFAYALFGSSMTLAVGPVAVVSLMTAAAVSQVATQGSPEYLGAAILLGLLSGIILMGLGFARVGFFANLLSHPVISGFISASAVLIAFSQLKHILGVPVHGHDMLSILDNLASHLDDTNLPTLVIGVLSITFLFWVRSGLKPLLMKTGMPSGITSTVTKAGPVMAVIVSTAIVGLFALNQSGVSIVGVIPKGLPVPTFPDLDLTLTRELLPAAFLISIVGFVESVSVGHTLAARRRERIQPNQELIGLGAANIASGLGGGFPVTGGFSRSVVNFDAGARTPLAGVMTAVMIALTALFLTPLFEYLPKAVLAATVIVAVLSLVDLKAIRRVWIFSKPDFWAMATTILVVLGIGVEAGIIAGILVSISFLLAKIARPHFAVIGQIPGTQHFRNVNRHDVLKSEKVLAVRLDEMLYFLNGHTFEDTVNELLNTNKRLTDLVLLCNAINEIDASGLEVLESINERLDSQGIKFHLSEVKGPIMDRLNRVGFETHLTGQIFLSHYEAMCTLDPDCETNGTTQLAGT